MSHNLKSEAFSSVSISESAKFDAVEQNLQTLLSQIDCYKMSAVKIFDLAQNNSNLLKNINQQNIASEEQALYLRDAVEKNINNSFDQMQNILMQAQAAQEIANAAFAIASIIELQAQAVQNISNACFLVKERALEQESLANCKFGSTSYKNNAVKQVCNCADSIAGIASSIQSMYYAARNVSEDAQRVTSNIYEYVNEVSNNSNF